MVYLNIRHTVSDYDRWQSGFDANRSVRRAAGATGKRQIFRDVENPNTVTVILEWDNVENAAKFLADPAVQEAMQKAGVVGTPTVNALQSRVKP